MSHKKTSPRFSGKSRSPLARSARLGRKRRTEQEIYHAQSTVKESGKELAAISKKLKARAHKNDDHARVSGLLPCGKYAIFFSTFYVSEQRWTSFESRYPPAITQRYWADAKLVEMNLRLVEHHAPLEYRKQHIQAMVDGVAPPLDGDGLEAHLVEWLMKNGRAQWQGKR